MSVECDYFPSFFGARKKQLTVRKREFLNKCKGLFFDDASPSVSQLAVPQQSAEDSVRPELSDSNSQAIDTWIYPLVQMGPFGVLNDEQATLRLLRRAARQDEILLTSGYFNLTDHYMQVILQESLAKYRLLMASPEVRKAQLKKNVVWLCKHCHHERSILDFSLLGTCVVTVTKSMTRLRKKIMNGNNQKKQKTFFCSEQMLLGDMI